MFNISIINNNKVLNINYLAVFLIISVNSLLIENYNEMQLFIKE